MLETVAVESTFHALCAYTSLDCLFPLMHHFSSSWLKVIKDRLDVYLIWKISNSWRLKKKFKCEFQDCYAGSRIMNFDRPSSFVIFLYTVSIWLSMTIQTVWPSHSLSLSLVYLSLFLSPLLKGQTCQLWSRRCLRTRMMLVLLLKKKFINESRIYIYVYMETDDRLGDRIYRPGRHRRYRGIRAYRSGRVFGIQIRASRNTYTEAPSSVLRSFC